MRQEKTDNPSMSTTVSIFVALLILLAVTVGVSRIELGRWSFAVAAFIATIKAVLILLYFMQVKFSERLVWVFAGAGFYWLGIAFTLTMSDYLTR